MTINERIRELRENLKISQTEFAEQLGSGRGVIKNIEEGRTEPKPQLLDLISRVYHVSRTWLETGEGEMRAPMSRNEKIGRFVGELMADEPDSFRRRLIDVLIELDSDGWQKLKEAAEVLAAVNGQKKEEDE